MSIKAYSWYWSQVTVGNGTRKLIAMAVAEFARSTCGHAWPYIGQIAKMAECSERTAIRQLAVLESSGLLIKVIHSDAPGRPNVYKVPFPDRAESDPACVACVNLRVTDCHPSNTGDKSGAMGDTLTPHTGDTRGSRGSKGFNRNLNAAALTDLKDLTDLNDLKQQANLKAPLSEFIGRAEWLTDDYIGAALAVANDRPGVSNPVGLAHHILTESLAAGGPLPELIAAIPNPTDQEGYASAFAKYVTKRPARADT